MAAIAQHPEASPALISQDDRMDVPKRPRCAQQIDPGTRSHVLLSAMPRNCDDVAIEAVKRSRCDLEGLTTQQAQQRRPFRAAQNLPVPPTSSSRLTVQTQMVSSE
ncbi:unnamed protein product [Jaminaea pallidilutea]